MIVYRSGGKVDVVLAARSERYDKKDGRGATVTGLVQELPSDKIRRLRYLINPSRKGLPDQPLNHRLLNDLQLYQSQGAKSESKRLAPPLQPPKLTMQPNVVLIREQYKSKRYRIPHQVDVRARSRARLDKQLGHEPLVRCMSQKLSTNLSYLFMYKYMLLSPHSYLYTSICKERLLTARQSPNVAWLSLRS